MYLLTLLIYVSKVLEENSVDPDQTDPTGSVWSGSTLFEQKASKYFYRWQKQMNFCVIGAKRV